MLPPSNSREFSMASAERIAPQPPAAPSPRPRAAIYARFSSDLQNARSAEDQVRVCRQYADRQGWDVIDVYSDLAISGTQNNRPGLNALLGVADARGFDIIVAEALDRVARNQADTATIFQRLEFAGVQLHTVSEQRVNELHVGMLGTMNALFVKELGAKIRRGQRGAVARGRVPGGLCYGYRAKPEIIDGQVELGHRAIVEDQASIIRRIFAMTIQGMGSKAIAHQLNAENIPAPRGGLWYASSITGSRGRVNGILHNPAYAGRIVYNRVTMKRNPETRRRVSRVNAESDRVEVVAEHLRIIEEATWAEVQRRHAANAHLPFHRQRRAKHMLSGLVRCGACGGGYTVISKDRWGCRLHREAASCPNGRRIATRVLEARVMAGLQDQLLAPDVVAAVVKRYHDARAQQQKAMKAGLGDALAAVERHKTAISRLIAAMAAGEIEIPELRAAVAAEREQLAIAQAQLAEHQALPAIILHPQIVAQYRRRIGLIGEAIVSGDRAKRFLPTIRALIETITVADDVAAPDRARVEVTGSLASVLALARGKHLGDGAPRTAKVVAKESYVLRSPLKSFAA